ncbi:MAG: hypothetical protein LBE91_17380 [Tannerella sp.]|jgi:hypothetical protein|nr:hypothetical protein [Tannerella sp.]
MKFFFLIISFSVIIQCAFTQTLRHGLLLGGGKGYLSREIYTANKFNTNFEFVSGIGKYKLNAMIGYKIRHTLSIDGLFFDTDFHVSVRSANIKIQYNSPQNGPSISGGIHDNDFIFCNAVLGLTANYKIINNLYTGIGLEPTYCFYELGERSDELLDMPIVVKLGYDFKIFDVAFVYKKGLFNVMKSTFVDSGKMNDIQLQLFIPF